MTAASQLFYFCLVACPLYNRRHVLVLLSCCFLFGCFLSGCCLSGFLLCDAAGWVRLDVAGTDPNGFAIAKFMAVELTATDACNTAIARSAALRGVVTNEVSE